MSDIARRKGMVIDAGRLAVELACRGRDDSASKRPECAR